MKTSFDKFMASNAVQEVSNVELGAVKINLGLYDQYQEFEKVIESNYTQIGKDVNLLKQAVLAANKHTDKVRFGLSTIKMTKAELANLRKEFQNQFKNLGVDFPTELSTKFDLLYKMLDDSQKSGINGMIDAKNALNTAY